MTFGRHTEVLSACLKDLGPVELSERFALRTLPLVRKVETTSFSDRKSIEHLAGVLKGCRAFAS